MSSLNFLFTDFYEIKMAYAFWRAGNHMNEACFTAYFRKNPFNGEFTVFAGLGRFLDFLKSFIVTDEDIDFLKNHAEINFEEGFYDYIKSLNFNTVKIYAVPEGTIVFPSVPLVQLVGPIASLQIVETALLNLTNFASLVATNAVHFRNACGPNIHLSEFGCRRAQGPDGALSSSLYSYIGGFDSTSNTMASKLFGLPLNGTLAHSFISSFSYDSQNNDHSLEESNKETSLFHQIFRESKTMLKTLEDDQIIETSDCSLSELKAFSSYASSFPSNFVALIDTYSVISSGLPNFCAIALALNKLGYRARGIRIDSGDLSYLSGVSRTIFKKIAQRYGFEWFSNLTIIASNELTVEIISSLNTQNHQIDVLGVGTSLVTCSKQPSLGMVYKLTEHQGFPTIKSSESVEKSYIPFLKKIYRLFTKEGFAILDLMTLWDEPPPKPNEQILCIHPYRSSVKVYVVPTDVHELHSLVFNGGIVSSEDSSISSIKKRVQDSLAVIRPDHKRLLNPTPYKVSVSQKLFDAFHNLLDKIQVKVIK